MNPKVTITVHPSAEEPVILLQAYISEAGTGRAFGPFRNDIEANAALDSLRAVTDPNGNWQWVIVPLVPVLNANHDRDDERCDLGDPHSPHDWWLDWTLTPPELALHCPGVPESTVGT